MISLALLLLVLVLVDIVFWVRRELSVMPGSLRAALRSANQRRAPVALAGQPCPISPELVEGGALVEAPLEETVATLCTLHALRTRACALRVHPAGAGRPLSRHGRAVPPGRTLGPDRPLLRT